MPLLPLVDCPLWPPGGPNGNTGTWTLERELKVPDGEEELVCVCEKTHQTRRQRSGSAIRSQVQRRRRERRERSCCPLLNLREKNGMKLGRTWTSSSVPWGKRTTWTSRTPQTGFWVEFPMAKGREHGNAALIFSSYSWSYSLENTETGGTPGANGGTGARDAMRCARDSSKRD